VPGNQGSITTSFKTAAQGNALTGTLRRGKITEFYAGAIANPNATDTFLQINISRITATGAGAYTSWTPVATDPADPAAINTSGINATAEATAITANSSLWDNGLNQRNSIRVVLPQESQYLIWPATSGNGLVLRILSTTFTTVADFGFTFME
jgi:hypothetical protein